MLDVMRSGLETQPRAFMKNLQTSDAPETVLSSRRRFRLGIGGGPLAISLIFHGVLVALGIAWIFKIIPEPEERSNIVMPRGGPPSEIHRKPSKPSVRSDQSRASAVGVTGAITLPDPEMSSRMVSLGEMNAG